MGDEYWILITRSLCGKLTIQPAIELMRKLMNFAASPALPDVPNLVKPHSLSPIPSPSSPG